MAGRSWSPQQDGGSVASPAGRFFVYALFKDAAMTKPFYIGKGSGKRIRGHVCPSSLRKRTPKNCAVKKVLAELGFIPSVVIKRDLTEAEAFDLERLLIAQHGRRDIGTGILANVTDGGEGVAGLIHSAEHRAKNSAALRGRVMTEEHRRKIGEAQRWRTVSLEHREALRVQRTGSVRSLEARIKTSNSLRGLPKTPEHRERLREAARVAWAARKLAATTRAAERVTVVLP